MKIYNSSRKDKRYVAVFNDGTKTHFGLKNGNTYIDHADDVLRKNYLKRHYKNEDWNSYKSAGSLSRWILWGNSDNINTNIHAYIKRFSL